MDKNLKEIEAKISDIEWTLIFIGIMIVGMWIYMLFGESVCL